MKKWLLKTALVMAGLTLAGCADDTVASTTAGRISEEELYEEMKNNVGESVLQQMILEDVLSDQYGEEVTDEEVDSQYTTEAESYGGEEAFALVLEQNNFTEESYKEYIRLNLLVETAVRANTELTEEEIQAAYDAYTPQVTAAHILVADEETAADLISQLNEGADFAQLAAENSTDTGTAANGGELTFGTGEMVEPFEVAALALEEGEITQEPIETEYGYHVIQMIEKPEKGTLEEESEGLEEQIIQERLNDGITVQTVLSEIMQDANIIINDEDLSNAMNAYLQTPEATTDSSTEDSSAADSSADSSEDSSAADSSVDSSTEDSSTADSSSEE